MRRTVLFAMASGAAVALAAACSSFSGDSGTAPSADGGATDAPNGEDALAPPAGDGGTTSDADVDPDLVAAWHFDEGAGSIAHDPVGFANDGTLEGDAGWTDAGHHGSALLLPPRPDSEPAYSAYVDVGANAETAQVLTTQAFTLAMWIKSPSTPTLDQYLFAMDTVFNVKLNGRYPQLGTAAGYVTAGLTADADQWHHVAATYDHGAVALFVDGFPAGVKTSTLDAAAPLANAVSPAIVIGVYSDGLQRAVGAIDEVMLWKRALSGAEIKTLAAK